MGMADSRENREGDLLPVVEKLITSEQLLSYAGVSGDRNPLHLDPEFAASTQFGGIIAHGMLTLAYVSEMLTLAFGQSWLSSGRLRVRFRGAAYPGDRVVSWGRVVKDVANGAGHTKECSVGLKNQRGEDLITGTAVVSVETKDFEGLRAGAPST